MPIQIETREIGRFKVTTEPLPSLRALLLFDQANRFVELRGAELEQFTRDILVLTRVETSEGEFLLSSKDAINRVFTGDLGSLLRTVGFAVEVNYGNFSSGPTESGEGPETERTPSSSTSPKTPTSPRHGRRGGSSSKGS